MRIEAVVFDWGGVLAGNVADRAAEVEQRFGPQPARCQPCWASIPMTPI